MDVCDPSGLLPTKDCPTTVGEVFLSGNEPAQTDTLFRTYIVNRETGFLATVFTPPELVEDKVFMIVPPEAQAWAKAANIPVAPASYRRHPGPAGRPGCAHQRTRAVQRSERQGAVPRDGLRRGLRPLSPAGRAGAQPAVVDRRDRTLRTRIEDGLLGAWDASGLSGLYAVELQVVRTDQQIDTAITQVTVK